MIVQVKQPKPRAKRARKTEQLHLPAVDTHWLFNMTEAAALGLLPIGGITIMIHGAEFLMGDVNTTVLDLHRKNTDVTRGLLEQIYNALTQSECTGTKRWQRTADRKQAIRRAAS
jgi:hypothetical protein